MTAIVLVDDDDADLALFAAAFVKRNPTSTIRTFRSADDALDEVERLVDNNVDVIVVTDLKMPTKDGASLIEQVRSDSSMVGVPAIVVSTSTHRPDYLRAYQAGASAYHAKPLGLDQTDQLVDLISAYWHDAALRP